MSRTHAWRRKCPEIVAQRMQQCSEMRFLLLSSTGPMGFVVKEDGQQKTFTVLLGDSHSCTCPTFQREKELCVHILWIMLKKLRMSPGDPLVFQLSYVEREIQMILQGAARSSRPVAEIKKAETPDPGGKHEREARPLDEDDVCPICQDELLGSETPTIHCRFGCGGSIHTSCLMEWAKHAASSGAAVILCPLCRVDMGSLADIQAATRQVVKKAMMAPKPAAPVDLAHFEHTGTTCNACSTSPIVGKCYRCTSCSLYYNCQKCFVEGMHLAHGFQFRETLHGRWQPAVRPSTMGAGLPGGVVQQLLGRDLSEEDYDLLLQLDQPSIGTTLSLSALSQLPSLTNCLTATVCLICNRKISPSQQCRQLHCQHIFHRDCIDPWLLHRRSTCPVDGSPVTVAQQTASAQPRPAPPKPRRASVSSADQTGRISLPSIFGSRLSSGSVDSLSAPRHEASSSRPPQREPHHLAPLQPLAFRSSSLSGIDQLQLSGSSALPPLPRNTGANQPINESRSTHHAHAPAGRLRSLMGVQGGDMGRGLVVEAAPSSGRTLASQRPPLPPAMKQRQRLAQQGRLPQTQALESSPDFSLHVSSAPVASQRHTIQPSEEI